MIPYPKPHRWQSAKYRKFVSSQPCIISGQPAEPHHVRLHSNAGTGLKPSDYWCLPISRELHIKWHTKGTKFMEKEYGFDVYQELFKMTSKWIEEESNA